MSRESDAELLRAINTPPEERDDAVAIIRNGLHAIGAQFVGVCWIETQNVVDKALAPYRSEIKRLRGLLVSRSDETGGRTGEAVSNKNSACKRQHYSVR